MTTNDAGRWHELRRAFDEIVLLEPSMREERLAAIVPSDLRDGVRRLLALHDDYSDSGVFNGVAIGTAVTSTLHRIDLSLDTSVDGFRIERVLGQGGMGRVYQAARTVGGSTQKVALKVVPFTLSNPRAMQMLRREREILVNLDHPGIARLIDIGELPDDRPYFAMEYVDGVPITQYAESRMLDMRARLALFLDVCDAVAYAHRQLVLHRDLKPSNILVDAEGRVRLLDFGIAKSLERSAGMQETTSDGGFSLSSAAPEQVLGRPTTMATDIYGLGCVLHQLLVGRAPFQEEAISARESIVRAIVEQPAPLVSASARTPDERASLVGDVDSIVAKTLRKQPSDRYRSVDALSADVRNLLEFRPIAARASENLYRFSMFLRRNRTAGIVATVLGAALLTATASSIWQSRRATAERDRAIGALASAQRERDHARQISDFLVNAFQGGRSIKDRNGSMRADELLESAAQSLEEDVEKRDPELRARISQTLSRLFYRTGKIPEALRQAERARAAFAQVEAPDIGLAAAQALSDAEAAYIQGRFKEAAAISGAMLERVGDGTAFEDGLMLFFLWSVQGRSTSMLGAHARAIAQYDKAIDLLVKRTDVGADRIGELKQLRAAVVSDSGDFAGARVLFEDLLIEHRARGTVSNQIETLRQLAIVCTRLRDHEPALRYAEEALARHLELLGEDHPRSAQLLRPKAIALANVNRNAEAIQVFRRAIEVGSRGMGEFNTTVALTYVYMASEYRFGLRNLDQAEVAARRGLETTPPELRFNGAYAMRVLCDVLIAQGRYFEAESYCIEAARIMDELRIMGDSFAATQIDLAYLKLRRFDVDGAWRLLTPGVVNVYQSERDGSRNIERAERFDEMAAIFGFFAYR